ncbi:hypothetical protein BDA99DRAFT_127334 [Phascolomyces articulosus]|uniref:SWI/SNF and RSC complexes subunit Ssr4 C-terminal domain-containing protein n=1 Tax=Phascolomyces articulosus TaxID=60185 RepID=A0AAD5KBA4_9FUNG|nr:hypothetical protein BDA99DRAFT_127334 [Phascolomyces articulosus]
MNNPAFYYSQGGSQMAGAGRGMPSAQMGAPPPHYMQQPAFRNMPPGAGGPPDPAAMQQQQPPPQQHHHRSKRQSKQAGALVENNDEPSGDELDDISARDIAMARYKRNHDYLSEIFTPYSAGNIYMLVYLCCFLIFFLIIFCSTASIVPPPLEIPQSKEDITKAIENEEKSINERTNKFEERLQALKQKQDGYWKLLRQLEKANDLEQFDEASTEFKNATGIKLEHIKENVQPIPIPGLEQDEPPVPQQPQPTGNRAGDHQPQQPQHQHQHQNGFVADFMNARVAAASGNNNNNNDGTGSGNGDIPSSGSMNMFGSYAPVDSTANQSGVDDSQNDFFDEMVNTGQDDDGGSVSEFLNSDMDFEQTTDNKLSETAQTTTEDVTMTEATIPSSSAIATAPVSAPLSEPMVAAQVTSSMEKDTPTVSSSPSLVSPAPSTITTIPTVPAPVASEPEPSNQVQVPATSATQPEIQAQVQTPTEQTTPQVSQPQTVPDAPVQAPTEDGKTNEGIPNP